MFDEIKTLLRAAMKAFGERIAPIEDDVAELKADVSEIKAFLDAVKNGGLDDIKAEVATFAKRTSGAATAASDPVAVVQAKVPDADPAHVQAAIDAHADAVTQGTDPVQAATVAATNAGATADTASAIAAAIPAPAAPAQVGGLPGALPASV